VPYLFVASGLRAFMSATRLHKLTALCFAVLYGLVGVTGESLHYLLTDPALLWPASQAAHSTAYYHTHGPDYHGHFHRHTHDAHHAHHAFVDERRAAGSHDELSLSDGESTHEPHACPSLALVSTLKIGHSTLCAASVLLDSLVTQAYDRHDVWTFNVAIDFQARGPPSGSLA
jgi:hypothetical protein